MNETAAPAPQPFCVCGGTQAEHIGAKPCVIGTPSGATALHELPVFGWAWVADGRQRHA